MFKVDTKVIYPKFGSGQITKITSEIVNEQSVDYYEIIFFHSQVVILVPTDKAKKLGLQKNYEESVLIEALKELGQEVEVTEKIINDLDTITKEKLSSGDIIDAIALVNIINTHSLQREEINKKISFTESKNLEAAINFISSITETILGIEAVKEYNLEID